MKVWDEKVNESKVSAARRVNDGGGDGGMVRWGNGGGGGGDGTGNEWDGRKQSNISFIMERHCRVKGLGSSGILRAFTYLPVVSGVMPLL